MYTPSTEHCCTVLFTFDCIPSSYRYAGFDHFDLNARMQARGVTAEMAEMAETAETAETTESTESTPGGGGSKGNSKGNSKTALMHEWREPVLSFHSIRCSNENTSVIPRAATARISIRTVPDQQTQDLFALVAQHLQRNFDALRSRNRSVVY